MKKLVILCSAIVCSIAMAQGASDVNSQAKTDAAAARKARIELAREMAPAKSLAEFYQQIQLGGAAGKAFEKLGANGQAVFVNSLVFNEKGLASFNFRVIEDTLAVRDAYQLLSVFGVQHITASLKGLRVENKTDQLVRTNGAVLEDQPRDPDIGGGGDYQNYWCSSRSTCSPRGNDICMSNC